MPTLFTPLAAGRLRLPNRILMAAMTRARAEEDGRINASAAQYYAQRASAGLIISEATYPVPMGKGYVRTPGLVTREQVLAWRRVTDAVHAEGGRIVVQLMHAGRISDPSLLPDGALPVAPSAIRPDGSTWTERGPLPHPTPRALQTHELRDIADGYAAAARRALDAGFDAVQLHAGSGYLPMQFLSTGSNLRSDRYGGSALNRARFTVELLEAIAGEIGADRTGLKITPRMRFNDIDDADPDDTYRTLLQALRPLPLAFVEVAPHDAQEHTHRLLRPLVDGAYFAGVGFDREQAADYLQQGRADAVLFGQSFLANPDLPRRFALGAALNTPDAASFYGGDARGYTDYPLLRELPSAMERAA